VREAGSQLPKPFFLGRYRVVDEIGVGGMASVHLARFDGPGGFQKWVAIKRIHPHLVEDDQFVDMFLDEARIAARINHANVATVFDLGKDENTYWICMEYLHGEPLREIMRRIEETNGRIPFHIAARICADAAEGLHAAHELRGRNGQLLNLVHRDVTPHNLFVTYEGYTKVVDFGIAKVVDRLASTRAGTLKGKLAYMSPEQVRGQEVDRRTDLFALGVVLWELTTNRRLFRMDTDLDTLEKVQACVVPLPSTMATGYPTELEVVVMKALAQRREDRYQSARELSRALQRFLMTQGTLVGPEDVGDYVKELFRDRVGSRERYLEWAAEVTSAVDVDELRKQQQNAESNQPSLLHTAAPSSSSAVGEPHAKAPAPATQRSHGQDSASASFVAAVPHAAQPGGDLASTSLMDEDEDIPTVVAQPREPAEPARGPRPAAGMRAGAGSAPQRGPQPGTPPGWDGNRTVLVPDQQQPVQFDSTIALPESQAAEEIRAKVDQMEYQQRRAFQQQQGQAFAAAGAAVAQPGYSPGGFAPQGYPAGPDPAPTAPHPYAANGAMANMNPMGPQAPGNMNVASHQAAIETKMSLPRPAAVAQWLMEQGDVEIQGPRSTGVIIAIAALATLCVMGVASLIVYRLREPQRPDSALVVPTAAKPVGTGSAVGSGANQPASAPAGTPPGRLTIACTPSCDQVIVDGKELGPGPIFGHALTPGKHEVTLKNGATTKTLEVSIASGEVTSRSVSML
jgi:serine/threonine-protein kinase